MYPEQRLVEVHKGIGIELFIVLVGAVLGILCIQRVRFVERFIFAVALVRKIDVVRHKRAVLPDERSYNAFVEEFLLFVRYVHNYLCAAVRLVALLYRVCGVAVRFPVHGGLVLIRLGENFNVFRYHISRIEAQSEVAYYAVAARLFIFGKEVGGTGKCYLSYVVFYLVGGHTYAVIFNGERFCVFIYRNLYAKFLAGVGNFAHIDKFFILGYGVGAVGDYLSQKDVFIGIEPLFDYGHHIFAGNFYIAFSFHK